MDVPAETAFDVILGAHFIRLLATGRAAGSDFAAKVADVVVSGLQAAPETPRAGPEGPAREEERSS